MIHVAITAELPQNETGPHEVYTERFELPDDFATDAAEAHARITTLLVDVDYIELPQRLGGIVPFRAETVRELWVWEAER